MRDIRTIKFQGHIYEYEIDVENIVYIKEGTTFISIGQTKALKPTDNVELAVFELIKSYLINRPSK